MLSMIMSFMYVCRYSDSNQCIAGQFLIGTKTGRLETVKFLQPFENIDNLEAIECCKQTIIQKKSLRLELERNCSRTEIRRKIFPFSYAWTCILILDTVYTLLCRSVYQTIFSVERSSSLADVLNSVILWCDTIFFMENSWNVFQICN